MVELLDSTRSWLKRGVIAAGCALALAACVSPLESGSGQRGPRFAEVDDPNNANPNAATNNIGSLSEVISRNPNDATAYNTRGAAYARAGRYSEAMSDFNRAVQLDPNLAPAFLNRGLASRQTGRNDAAMQDFNRAISIDANYGPAYLARTSRSATMSAPLPISTAPSTAIPMSRRPTWAAARA
jgi:Tfp pilus assembly protein PilF